MQVRMGYQHGRYSEMSSFTNALITKHNADGRTYTVERDFIFWADKIGSGYYVEVPKGFITDLASIRRILQWLTPKQGKFDQGAVVHDKLYKDGTCERLTKESLISEIDIDRAFADKMFYKSMGVLEVHPWRRWLIYYGVRLGGWVAWDRHRRKDKQ